MSNALPPKIRTVIEANEAQIKKKFGEPLYERLIGGTYNLNELLSVRRYLQALG